LPPFVRAYGKYNATTDTYILPSWLLSLITSTINLGEVVGAIVSHPINMKFGRRGGIYIACGIFLLGILFQAVAPIVALLVIGRFFLGTPQ
jgi:MFS family permease